MSSNFGDRLTEANRRTGTVLCMGIDPHCHMIPQLFGNAIAESGSPQAISAIGNFVTACLDSAIGKVAAIKPQAAFFEQQGPDGMRLLQSLGRAAIDAGMLVIMDAKRGDIGSTSAAYAQAWIGHDAAFPSDALTVNPWLGIDTLEPFLAKQMQQLAVFLCSTAPAMTGPVICRIRWLMAPRFISIWPACWPRWRRHGLALAGYLRLALWQVLPGRIMQKNYVRRCQMPRF